MKSIAAAGALGVLALCVANVGAQGANTREQTFLTFSHAVELPGVRLEPGTYEFRMADVFQKDVIQVFRKDSNEPIGQWTFVQAERPQAKGETVVMFRETAEGTTPAIQYWYYPGESVGKEFIYPEDQAERIAARTGQRVRSDSGYVSPPASAGARSETDAVGTSGERDTERDATDRDVESVEPDDEIGQSLDSGADIDASVEARAAASSADADVDVDADADLAGDASAPNQTSAFTQPSAPAGSTTGVRSTSPSGDAAAVQLDAQLEPEARESDDLAAAQDQPASAAGQTTASRSAAPASPRPVGTSGVAGQDAEAAAFERQNELPRTASPLALTGIIGLLSLAGTVGLRLYR